MGGHEHFVLYVPDVQLVRSVRFCEDGDLCSYYAVE